MPYSRAKLVSRPPCFRRASCSSGRKADGQHLFCRLFRDERRTSLGSTVGCTDPYWIRNYFCDARKGTGSPRERRQKLRPARQLFREDVAGRRGLGSGPPPNSGREVDGRHLFCRLFRYERRTSSGSTVGFTDPYWTRNYFCDERKWTGSPEKGGKSYAGRVSFSWKMWPGRERPAIRPPL